MKDSVGQPSPPCSVQAAATSRLRSARFTMISPESTSRFNAALGRAAKVYVLLCAGRGPVPAAIPEGTGNMAKDFPALTSHHREFIARQHIFFTASAAAGTRINLSPRSTDCFRVLSDNSACYLDRTGSGNETAAHLLADGRLTIMFCAMAGPPLILRLYGRGRTISRGSDEYRELLAAHFAGTEPLGARQIIRLDFDRVKTSCGYGVPLHEYKGERDTMDKWALAKGPEGLEAYWREKNLTSIDGLPTGLLDD